MFLEAGTDGHRRYEFTSSVIESITRCTFECAVVPTAPGTGPARPVVGRFCTGCSGFVGAGRVITVAHRHTGIAHFMEVGVTLGDFQIFPRLSIGGADLLSLTTGNNNQLCFFRAHIGWQYKLYCSQRIRSYKP